MSFRFSRTLGALTTLAFLFVSPLACVGESETEKVDADTSPIVNHLGTVCPPDGINVSGGASIYDERSGAVYMRANIIVRSLGYKKRVGLVYTTDHWATNHVVEASYAGNAGFDCKGKELWNLEGVQIAGPGYAVRSKLNFEYAAFYEDLEHSVTYWDNNSGQNYSAR